MLDDVALDDIGYDPFDVKVMGNPHPYYERLRNEHPDYVIIWLEAVLWLTILPPSTTATSFFTFTTPVSGCT